MRVGGLTRGHLTLGASACHQLGVLDPGASGDHPPVLWIEVRVPFGFGAQSPWGGCHKGLFTSEGEGWGSIRALKLGATWAHSHPQGLGTSRREPVRTALACLAVGKTRLLLEQLPQGSPRAFGTQSRSPQCWQGQGPLPAPWFLGVGSCISFGRKVSIHSVHSQCTRRCSQS